MNARDTTRVRTAAGLESLAMALVLFPAAVALIAVAGFAVGLALGPWVLVAAAAGTFIGVRVAAGSWSTAARTILAAAVVHVVAAAIAAAVPDGSWDGLSYQQEGILRLAAGWNPLFQDAAAFGHGNDLFINHYPKLSWISGATMLVTTHHVESGKLLNLTLLLGAAAEVGSALLRLSTLGTAAVVALSVLAALNPVVVYQGATFYVDGALASTLAILIAALATYVLTRRRASLAVALVAACVAVNLKFTGLAYAAVLEALAVLFMWWRAGLRPASRLAVRAAAGGLVAVAVIGYSPYLRNVIEHGNPVYSAPTGDVAGLRPVNLNDRNRFMRFALSNLSRTAPVRAPDGARLKWPWSVARSEARTLYGADMTVGGFGPLFGATLLLSTVSALILLAAPTTRRRAAVVLLVAFAIGLSMFVHGETWWARYVPQAWLVPALIVMLGFEARRWSLPWAAGCAVAALMVLDLGLVSANVGWDELRYVRENRAALHELSAARLPVHVYFGAFPSLRERLREAGVAFRVVDAPPRAQTVDHALPAPGHQAFWFY